MHTTRFASRRAWTCSVIILLAGGGLAAAATATFQEGVNGYAGTSDTWIGGAFATTDYSTSTAVEWDGEDAGGQNFGLLRFNNIFDNGAGQIPQGATVNSATLTYVVIDAGNTGTMNEIAIDWVPTVTYNTFGGAAGVQTSDYGTQAGSCVGTAGAQTLNVTASLAAWSLNPAANRGWIFRPTGGTDGVQFVSSNDATTANRPRLTVTYTVATAVDISPDSISTVVGKANVPITVSIPPSSNATVPVTVTLTTSNAAAAVPVGASGNSLTLTFAAGGSNSQATAIDIGQAGSASITTTNDASLANDTLPVTVAAGAVAIAPVAINSGNGTSVPMSVSVPAGSTETRSITVSLTTGDPAVAVPAGASGNTLNVTFAQGGATQQWINMQCGQVGSTTVSTTNSGGLGNVSLPVGVFAGFNFTVTADPRSQTTNWGNVLAAIQQKITNVGVFHVSPGDIDPPAPLRDALSSRFGSSILWYPIIGNHEEETPEDMTWVRAEYQNGNGVRTALKYATNQDGPAGSVETTFSWDYGNAHFIAINQYWNGGTAAGSDVALDGDICPALYNWLAADLAANTKPVVFVFGHEPAYPLNRHVGDSLDKYPANRNAFWNLMQSYGVHAYLVGHTHIYSKFQNTTNGTWQIDVGNAGNDTDGDGQTFANLTVTASQVTYDIWRNKTGSWVKAESWSSAIGSRLIVNPTWFTHNVRIGGSLANDTFTVTSVGAQSNYSVTIDGSPAWLSVSPTAGSSLNQAIPHTITYSTAGLAIGPYTATIRVTDPASLNNPQTVTVNVNVTSVQADYDGDNDVDQVDFGHFQFCLSGEAAQTDPTCTNTKFDGDDDVDQADLLIFVTCFSGPNRPIPAGCP